MNNSRLVYEGYGMMVKVETDHRGFNVVYGNVVQYDIQTRYSVSTSSARLLGKALLRGSFLDPLLPGDLKFPPDSAELKAMQIIPLNGRDADSWEAHIIPKCVGNLDIIEGYQYQLLNNSPDGVPLIYEWVGYFRSLADAILAATLDYQERIGVFK